MSAWLERDTARRRIGFKGPRAADLLAAAGLALPEAPNTWAGDGWNVVCRLGSTEFFVEEAGESPGVAALEAQLERAPAGAYPVLRADAALVLGGDAAPEVLAQVCNVELAALPLAARPVVMTLMIGVGVLALPQADAGGSRIYRIWCDPTFAPYLESNLRKTIHPGRAQ